jgi:hypothetical protein
MVVDDAITDGAKIADVLARLGIASASKNQVWRIYSHANPETQEWISRLTRD